MVPVAEEATKMSKGSPSKKRRHREREEGLRTELRRKKLEKKLEVESQLGVLVGPSYPDVHPGIELVLHFREARNPKTHEVEFHARFESSEGTVLVALSRRGLESMSTRIPRRVRVGCMVFEDSGRSFRIFRASYLGETVEGEHSRSA